MSQKLDSLLAKPFGDETDPRGFWLLLMEHIANMKVRNYSVEHDASCEWCTSATSRCGAWTETLLVRR